MLKLILIIILLFSNLSVLLSQTLDYKFQENFKFESKFVKNKITFSGPMGMGLSESFNYKEKKVCVYNTVDGQKAFLFDKFDTQCPSNLHN